MDRMSVLCIIYTNNVGQTILKQPLEMFVKFNISIAEINVSHFWWCDYTDRAT